MIMMNMITNTRIDEEGYYHLTLEPEEYRSWLSVIQIITGKTEKRDMTQIKIEWISEGSSMADSIEKGGFAKFKVSPAQTPSKYASGRYEENEDLK